jgi:hypothetical protein
MSGTTSSIICVSRTAGIRWSYPYSAQPDCPELESVGPVQFDLAGVRLWLHDSQKNGGQPAGQLIYDHLKRARMLEGCFGLCDFEELRKKGPLFSSKYFGSKGIVGLKSVLRCPNGNLIAPYLRYADYMDVIWRDLSFDFTSFHPTPFYGT